MLFSQVFSRCKHLQNNSWSKMPFSPYLISTYPYTPVLHGDPMEPQFLGDRFPLTFGLLHLLLPLPGHIIWPPLRPCPSWRAFAWITPRSVLRFHFLQRASQDHPAPLKSRLSILHTFSLLWLSLFGPCYITLYLHIKLTCVHWAVSSLKARIMTCFF